MQRDTINSREHKWQVKGASITCRLLRAQNTRREEVRGERSDVLTNAVAAGLRVHAGSERLYAQTNIELTITQSPLEERRNIPSIPNQLSL